jgi:hypothetical protein
MGALPVKQYALYKEVRKRDYATLRVPVGMPRELWQAKLRQSQVDAAFSHAKWAAKRLAYWVETRRRVGVGVSDSLELLESNAQLSSRLGLFQVHEVLRPFAMKLARALVVAAQKAS